MNLVVFNTFSLVALTSCQLYIRVVITLEMNPYCDSDDVAYRRFYLKCWYDVKVQVLKSLRSWVIS